MGSHHTNLWNLIIIASNYDAEKSGFHAGSRACVLFFLKGYSQNPIFKGQTKAKELGARENPRITNESGIPTAYGESRIFCFNRVRIGMHASNAKRDSIQTIKHD